MARLGYEVIVPGRVGFEQEEAGVVAAVSRDVPGAKIVVPDVKLELGNLSSVRAFAAWVAYRDPLLRSLLGVRRLVSVSTSLRVLPRGV